MDRHSWTFLAKTVADYCNDTVLKVMDYAAVEVVYFTKLLADKNELDRLTNTHGKTNI